MCAVIGHDFLKMMYSNLIGQSEISENEIFVDTFVNKQNQVIWRVSKVAKTYLWTIYFVCKLQIRFVYLYFHTLWNWICSIFTLKFFLFTH